MAKEKSSKSKKIILALVCGIVLMASLIAGANYMMLQNLIRFGNSYDKIEFENQLVLKKIKTATGTLQQTVSLRLCT